MILTVNKKSQNINDSDLPNRSTTMATIFARKDPPCMGQTSHRLLVASNCLAGDLNLHLHHLWFLQRPFLFCIEIMLSNFYKQVWNSSNTSPQTPHLKQHQFPGRSWARWRVSRWSDWDRTGPVRSPTTPSPPAYVQPSAALYPTSTATAAKAAAYDSYKGQRSMVNHFVVSCSTSVLHKLVTAFCSHSKWNDGLHGADVDRYKPEIILINFALDNNF